LGKERKENDMTNRFAYVCLLVALLCGTSQVFAAEWESVDLSGEFEGISDTKGSGQTSYSFALRRTVEQGGDLMFALNFSTTKEIIANLTGGRFLDLGALSAPPSPLTIPKDFIGQYENPKYRIAKFLVGHYYYMNKEPLHVLMQITDFVAGPRSEIKKTWHGTTERATGRISFRYISSDKGLDGINRILGGTTTAAPSGTHPTSLAPTAPSQQNPFTTPAVTAPVATEAGPLAAVYEQFQKDAKAFLDLPTEQATVPKCDVLLATAKNLTTRINDQVGEVDSTITGNGAKMSSLNDRLAKITDLQLIDRTQTRISKIKEETERLQTDMKEWTAKLDELQKAEKKLREYRLIIGI
jgi:hypothetical protein